MQQLNYSYFRLRILYVFILLEVFKTNTFFYSNEMSLIKINGTIWIYINVNVEIRSKGTSCSGVRNHKQLPQKSASLEGIFSTQNSSLFSITQLISDKSTTTVNLKLHNTNYLEGNGINTGFTDGGEE